MSFSLTKKVEVYFLTRFFFGYEKKYGHTIFFFSFYFFRKIIYEKRKRLCKNYIFYKKSLKLYKIVKQELYHKRT